MYQLKGGGGEGKNGGRIKTKKEDKTFSRQRLVTSELTRETEHDQEYNIIWSRVWDL